ncbi:MAG: hypothetical protein IJU01_00525 [Lachnospiraceae bacterium]|nr:hypothetical protein [Lachnospiraceae bacterium]
MKVLNPQNEEIKKIYQWDAGLILEFEFASGGYAHFKHEMLNEEAFSLAIDSEGRVPLPNQLLQYAGTLTVYRYLVSDNYEKTVIKNELTIAGRPEPPEYILDPTPVISYPELIDLVADMRDLRREWSVAEAHTETLDPGEDAGVEVEVGEHGVSFLFGIPRGRQGNPGMDGNGIVSVEKTSTSGLVDTYTIRYTKSIPTTFDVTNGKDGNPGLNGAEGLSMYINTKSTSTSEIINDMVRERIDVPDGRTLKVNDLVLLTKNSNVYVVTGFPSETLVAVKKIGTLALPADGSITTDKLATGAVTNAKIADATIDGAKMRDGAVYASKIANNAVTEAKIQASAVSTEKMAAKAVTTPKIADEAVTSAKLDPALYSRIYNHTVLLWENTDVESGMGNEGEAVFNQTLNPSIYSQITIEFAITNTSSERVEMTIPAETFGSGSGIVYRASVDYRAFNSTAKPRGRQIKGLSTSKMTFSNGYEDGAVNSQRMVPTRIWGIR